MERKGISGEIAEYTSLRRVTGNKNTELLDIGSHLVVDPMTGKIASQRTILEAEAEDEANHEDEEEAKEKVVEGAITNDVTI